MGGGRIPERDKHVTAYRTTRVVRKHQFSRNPHAMCWMDIRLWDALPWPWDKSCDTTDIQ